MYNVKYFLGESKLGIALHTRIISKTFIYLLHQNSWQQPEGSIFNSYYTEVPGKVLLFSLDCPTLPYDFHFGPLANTLSTRPMSCCSFYDVSFYTWLTYSKEVHGIRVINIENGHGKPNSNPGQNCLHFTLH